MEAIREKIGPFRTVFGIKLLPDRLAWEFYFYDYARRHREVSITRVLRAIRPFLRCDLPVISQYGLWVANGCAGEWEIKREGTPQANYQGGPGYDHDRDHDRDHQGGPGWDRQPAYYAGSFSDGHSHCSSGQGSGPVYCQSNGAFRYANPLRVNGACVQNRTWGVSQYGLWVANGCAGEWEIKR